MAVFGRYESMQELSRSPFGSVYSAKPLGSEGAASYIVKTFNPRGLGVDEMKSDPDVQRFLQRVQIQLTAATSKSLHWAPIIESGVAREGAYYVSKFYPSSAARLIKGKVRLEPMVLHSIARNALEGLRELKAACNQPHGNLNAGSILLDRRDKTGYGDIVLAEPATPDEAAKAGGEAGDMIALGEVIYQLVTHRPFVGVSGWPVQPGAEWGRLGAKGKKWLDLVNRLLDPSAKEDLLNLDTVAKEVHRLRVGRKVLSVPAIALIVLLGLGAGGAVGYVQYSSWKRDWKAYCGEYSQWFKQFYSEYDAGGDLRNVLESDAYLKDNVLKMLEEAKGKNIRFRLQDITGRTVPDTEQAENVPMSMATARETREALHIVRKLRDALEGAKGIGLSDLTDAQKRWESRGWLGPAKYLENLRQSAQPGPSSKFGSAIADVRDVQVDIKAIEDLWTVVDGYRATLEATKSPMLKRFGELVRKSSRIEANESQRETLKFLAGSLMDARDEGKALTEALVPEKMRVLNWPVVEAWEKTQTVEKLAHLRSWPGEVLKNKKYWLNLGPDPRLGFEPGTAIVGLGKQLTGFDEAAKELGAEGEEAVVAKDIAGSKATYQKRIDGLDKLVKDLKGMDWQNPEEEDRIRGTLASSKSELEKLAAELPKSIADAKEKAELIRLKNYEEVVARWKKQEMTTKFPAVSAAWVRQRDVLLTGVNQENLRVAVQRLTGVQELLKKLDEDPALVERIELPERKNLAWNAAVEDAAEAIAAPKRQDILIKTLATLKADGTPSVDVALWNEQFGAYKKWVAEASGFLEAFNRIGDMLDAAYGSAEAGPEGKTIVALLAEQKPFSDGAVSVVRAADPVTSRLADLRQYETTTTAQNQLFAALKKEVGVQNAAPMRAAWQTLRKSGWPAGPKDLPLAVEASKALESTFNTLADKGRATKLVADVEGFRIAALRNALLSGKDHASVEEALKTALSLKGQLGLSNGDALSDAELQKLNLANDATFRFNYALYQYRKSPVADKAKDADAQPRVKALVTALPATGPKGTEEFNQILAGLAKESPSNEDPATAAPEAGPTMGPTKGAWGKPKVAGDLMTFTAAGGRTLTFVRVTGASVKGKVVTPFYLSTGEASVGLVRDLMQQAKLKVEQLGLPGSDDAATPQVWNVKTLAPLASWYSPVQVKLGAGFMSRYAAGLISASDNTLFKEAEDNPSMDHPIQRVAPDAAMYIASLAGCRLPTSEEWQAARPRQKHPANLRDATWQVQQNHYIALRMDAKTSLHARAPDRGRFLPANTNAQTDQNAVAWTAKDLQDESVPTAPGNDDKTVFFRKAEVAGDPYGNLIGNVAEFTWDDAKGFMDLKDKTLDGIAKYAKAAERSTDKLFVVGGSGISPPELKLGPHGVKVADVPGEGYADVGFRLAFPAGRRSIADRLKEAVENQPYLATAAGGGN